MPNISYPLFERNEKEREKPTDVGWMCVCFCVCWSGWQTICYSINLTQVVIFSVYLIALLPAGSIYKTSICGPVNILGVFQCFVFQICVHLVQGGSMRHGGDISIHSQRIKKQLVVGTHAAQTNQQTDTRTRLKQMLFRMLI